MLEKIGTGKFNSCHCFLYLVTSEGKTLQALVGVAIAHCESTTKSRQEEAKSLVVCPSSVVGHWVAEIQKFFSDRTIFRPLAFIGSSEERKKSWKCDFGSCNIVVTSYAALRSDAEILTRPMWRFCILDEGHLLRNPRTGEHTAHAF